MLKIKLQGLESIEFNKKLAVKGEITGYSMEHLVLEGKLCETSTIIYPTGRYEDDIEKFSSICTEFSCNKGKLVAFDSKNHLIEYFDVNGEIFTVGELFARQKDKCAILYGCNHTGRKLEKEQLQSLVRCNSEYGCDFCMYSQEKYYAFELDGNKVRLEVFGEGAMNEEDIEYRIYITTPKLMKEIEKAEAEERICI